jgi:hypothetical protein
LIGRENPAVDEFVAVVSLKVRLPNIPWGRTCHPATMAE